MRAEVTTVLPPRPLLVSEVSRIEHELVDPLGLAAPLPRDASELASHEPRAARMLEDERETVRPPSAGPAEASSDPVHELLFRLACGDFEGALSTADVLWARVPVVIMPREVLRAEPLGYWELLLLSRLDGEEALAQLLQGIPPVEAIRVVCALVERGIIALR